MKKLLSLILIASLILSLTSCNMLGEVEQINDSLTIYVDENCGFDRYLEYAIRIYKYENPDVILNIVDLDTDQDYTKMRTEIMGRSGPDVILVYGYAFPDAEKTMATGVFADLTPFLEADPNYNKDDYYSQIMEAGQYKGLQCVFPMTFTIPTIITTQEGLDKYDLKFSDKPDLLEFTEQSVGFINQNNSMELFPYQPNRFGRTSFNYFNIISDIVDYESYTINLKSEEFLQATRNYKEFYKAADLNNTTSNTNDPHFSNDISKKFNKSFMFFNTNYYANIIQVNFQISSELKGMEQTPIAIPIYGFDEMINAKMDYGLAINNYSHHKQNAYDFIKIALDAPFYESSRISNGYSIKKSELQNALNYNNESVDNGHIDGIILEQDVVEQQQSFIDDIGSCSISTKIPDLLYEYFVPYFEDKATLEECVEVAQRKMEIYMSE